MKRPTTRHRPPPSNSLDVRIRMYDVGFGDCFLLFIPTTSGERKILIDCGSIAAHKKTTAEIIDQVIADIAPQGVKPCIDIVVATHRHRDHISGFSDPRWSEVEVKEVWMPWTERPNDPVANRIRQAQTRLAVALHKAFLRTNAAPELVDLALNAQSNDDAMQVLHHGFAGSPLRRFLPERDRQDTFVKADLLPGVFVHALGPSYDEDVIRDMDPPAGQSYLRFGRDEAGDEILPEPFSQDWVDEEPFLRLDPDIENSVRAEA